MAIAIYLSSFNRIHSFKRRLFIFENMSSSDPFRYEVRDNKTYIWDAFRKKFVFLSKEEWVRQNILYYLVHEKGYQSSSISVEKQIQVGNTRKRYDAVVYIKEKPWLLLECKEEGETLNEKVLQQVLAYTSVMQISFLAVTNGKQAYTYDLQQAKWIQGFPTYPDELTF